MPVRGVRPSGAAPEGSAGHAAADEFSVAAGSLGGSLSAQLLELEQLATLGRLLGVAAHELANPLSFIHGNIGLVERHATELWEHVARCESELARLDGAALARVVERRAELEVAREELPYVMRSVRVGTDRCVRIVRDVRELARDGTGSHAIDLAALVEAAVRLAEPLMRTRVVIEVVHEGPLPLVSGRQAQLGQVVLALLVNAAEAIDGPGTIRVTLSPLPASSSSGGGQHARVAVADSGPGVPASQGERIFLPFVTTKGERAIGLGLAIGRVIARAHGGELRLDDECAVGARFLLDLPAAAASLPTGSP